MDQTRASRKRTLFIAAAFSTIAAAAFSMPAALAQTIIDEWAAVKAPPPPELKPVTIDPKTSALLNAGLRQAGLQPRAASALHRVYS